MTQVKEATVSVYGNCRNEGLRSQHVGSAQLSRTLEDFRVNQLGNRAGNGVR